MNPCDPVVVRQIPVIQKIIQDETWLEGERRGCHVRPDDRVVRENVCRVILQVGQQLRETVTRDLPAPSPSAAAEMPAPRFVLAEGTNFEI